MELSNISALLLGFSINVKFVRFMPILCSSTLYTFADEIMFIHMKMFSQSIWLWRQAGLTFGRAREPWVIDSTLKAGIQNLTCSRTQYWSNNLKGAWVRGSCWSWRASQRGKRQLDSPWGHRHWKQPFCGAPSTMWTLALATAILESSLYLLAPVPRPTHQPVDNNTGAGQATSQAETQRHPQASLLS